MKKISKCGARLNKEVKIKDEEKEKPIKRSYNRKIKEEHKQENFFPDNIKC